MIQNDLPFDPSVFNEWLYVISDVLIGMTVGNSMLAIGFYG